MKRSLNLLILFFSLGAVSQEISAEQVLKNYMEAIGGKDAIESIQSVQTSAKGKLGEYQIKVEVTYLKNGNYCEVSYMDGMLTSSVFYDDSAGYTYTVFGGKEPFSEEELIEYKAHKHPIPELELTATYEGAEMVMGEPAYKIIMSDNSINFYSQKTGLKLKTITNVGSGSESSVQYKDYKEVDGVKFPSRLELWAENEKFVLEAETRLNEDFSNVACE